MSVKKPGRKTAIAAIALGGMLATSSVAVAQDERPFEGETVTVAVGSFMSSGVSIFKDDWEERTGANLEIVEIPFGDLYQRLVASYSTGAGQFDVAVYAANWIPEYVRDGYLLSLEQFYGGKDNWDSVLPKTQQIMYVGGERYSIPLDGDVIIGYYRTDALDNPEYQAQFEDQYGYPLAPPTTWVQYRDIAEFFTGWDWAGSGSPGFGVLEAQKAKDVGPFILSSRAAAYAAHPDVPGSLFFDPETMAPQVGNPGWVRALEDWVDIRQFGPPEMANYGGGDMRGNFVAGDFALGIDWADVGIIAQDETASTVKGKLGYFVLPGSTDVWNLQTGEWDSFAEPSQAPYLGWGGWHGSLAGNTDVPDAAWDLLNFIDSDENAFTAVTTPGTARNPYRADHFSDPSAWEDAPVAYADPGPYLDTQALAMNHPNTQFDLRIPRAGLYFDVLDNWAQQALGGGLSAEEALAEAAREWEQITADEGVDAQRTAYRDLYGINE